MKKIAVVIMFSGCLIFILASGFKTNEQDYSVTKVVNLFKQDKKILIAHLESLEEQIKNYKDKEEEYAEIKNQLNKCRGAYKEIEYFMEYFYPDVATRINKPLVIEIEDLEKEIDYPQGLQVLENKIYESSHIDSEKLNEINNELYLLKLNMEGLSSLEYSFHNISNDDIITSLKLELFRIATLGLSGYDTPEFKGCLRESKMALSSMYEIIQVYYPSLNKKYTDRADFLFAGATEFLDINNDFENFNRLYFITAYCNPLNQLMNEIANDLNLEIKPISQYVNLESDNLFDIKSFTTFYNELNNDRIELGKTLFFDPILSGNMKRSCASCHNPDKAFTDGLTKSIAFNPQKNVNRNSPTIINSCLQISFFHDARATSLEDQIIQVVNNENELNNNFQTIIMRLNKSPKYRKLFKNAYGEAKRSDTIISTFKIIKAIADFERSLTGFNSAFDQYLAGNKNQLSESQIRGFNLFMGKAQCGTCHFPPLFNGMLPPYFIKSELEVLGTPGNNDFEHPIADKDSGRAALTNIDLQNFSFKVPTVRNIALTAPYMHNGIYNSLEEVMTFYNHGGGLGLGLQVENQTLAGDSLQLTQKEISDVINFMNALTDTTYLVSVPHSLPGFTFNRSINNRKIGGDY